MTDRRSFFRHERGAVAPSSDFNPRDLVRPWAMGIDCNTQHQDVLDAIYVPTRGRRENIAAIARTLGGCGIPLYFMPTRSEDLPLLEARTETQRLDRTDSDFNALVRSLRCSQNPTFSVPEITWDLPAKRNHALWHARQNRFHHILLLDDDIRGLGPDSLVAGRTALHSSAIAGFFVDEFPDTSVIGHIELSVGENVLPFLSGSCLFVRVDCAPGFFPPIYNEDWIFMAPAIERGEILSLGLIGQEKYDPFSDPSLPAFQAPGEIIADGLFALLFAGRYRERFSPDVWTSLLRRRREDLRVLSSKAVKSYLCFIEASRKVCCEISGEDCASYVKDWEHDRLVWNTTLKELA